MLAMIETDSPVTLRCATEADQDFLLELFACTRSDELAALAWNPDLRKSFLLMQFNAQRQSYQAAHPTAQNNIITRQGVAVGRMLVDYGDETIALVDIAILPEERNQGLGSFLIQRLLEDGDRLQKPVELSVFKTNPAARLYQRLGFSCVGDDGVYFQMIRSPAKT